MAEKTVVLVINHQQLELMDKAIAQRIALDRVALVRLALREFAEPHTPDDAKTRRAS